MFITLAIRRRTHNFCKSYKVSILYPRNVSRIHEKPKELKEVETQPAWVLWSDAQWRRESMDHRV